LELTEKNRMVRKMFDPVQFSDRMVEKTACSNNKFYNSQTYCYLYSVYSNTCRTVIYKSIQSYSKPVACFRLIWPSSGRYSTKKHITLANYVTVVQL
jgi:hypothetical protein